MFCYAMAIVEQKHTQYDIDDCLELRKLYVLPYLMCKCNCSQKQEISIKYVVDCTIWTK